MALSCTERSVSLIVLGIVSLITLIANAVTASVSLAQSIQADSLSSIFLSISSCVPYPFMLIQGHVEITVIEYLSFKLF